MHWDSKGIYLDGCSLTKDWRIWETMRENRTFNLTGALNEKKIYFLLITRTKPANPIAPIAASGTMPALVVAGTLELVQTVVGSESSGVSASSGRVVVAVRIFVCAALTGGTTLTT